MTQTHDLTLRIAGVHFDSLVDGEGVRAAIFFSGCRHRCPGCHNQAAQNPDYGQRITEDLLSSVARGIADRPYLSGVTLTGGDPLFKPEETLAVYEHLCSLLGYRPDVWLYSGEKWEDVKDLPLMKVVSVMVDGLFEREHADKRLAFRGSLNQRLIDVQASLQEGKTVLWLGNPRAKEAKSAL